MKKIIALLLCVILCLGMFSGCGDATHTADADEEIKIVTTIFPIYDWTMNMIGDEAENYDVTMLIDNGVDMHSYQATTADMVTIHTCDVLIYVGGESDLWIEDLLSSTTNTDMIVINLVDVLGDVVVFEELVEGMEATEHSHDTEEECTDEECEEDHDHEEECTDECCEEDHDHDEECTDEECEEDHDHDHDEECTDEECEEDHDHEDEECEDECCEDEIDEHVWLSLTNAETICSVIADTLASLDSANASTYSSNFDSYAEKLQSLDSEYAEMVSTATGDTLLFADRFPFRYFVEDYNINYYAAFAGCSSETEASFETVAFLAGKVDELGLEKIIVVEGVAHKIAETVISATANQNQTILSVNAMETITSADIANGVTYISVMQENLEVFKDALN